MVYAHTTITLLSSIYTFYKANILLPCYITLFVSEPSMTFSVSYKHVTVVTVTVMLPNSNSKSKIKWKNKLKKNKMRKIK